LRAQVAELEATMPLEVEMRLVRGCSVAEVIEATGLSAATIWRRCRDWRISAEWE
jgi:predicted DNA-binding transcriptional regulator AlpA